MLVKYSLHTMMLSKGTGTQGRPVEAPPVSIPGLKNRRVGAGRLGPGLAGFFTSPDRN